MFIQHIELILVMEQLYKLTHSTLTLCLRMAWLASPWYPAGMRSFLTIFTSWGNMELMLKLKSTIFISNWSRFLCTNITCLFQNISHFTTSDKPSKPGRQVYSWCVQGRCIRYYLCMAAHHTNNLKWCEWWVKIEETPHLCVITGCGYNECV